MRGIERSRITTSYGAASSFFIASRPSPATSDSTPARKATTDKRVRIELSSSTIRILGVTIRSETNAKSVQCAIRQNEDPPREVRLQRFPPVVALQDGRAPAEDVGVIATEVVPRRSRARLHPFVDQD